MQLPPQFAAHFGREPFSIHRCVPPNSSGIAFNEGGDFAYEPKGQKETLAYYCADSHGNYITMTYTGEVSKTQRRPCGLSVLLVESNEEIPIPHGHPAVDRLLQPGVSCLVTSHLDGPPCRLAVFSDKICLYAFSPTTNKIGGRSRYYGQHALLVPCAPLSKQEFVDCVLQLDWQPCHDAFKLEVPFMEKGTDVQVGKLDEEDKEGGDGGGRGGDRGGDRGSAGEGTGGSYRGGDRGGAGSTNKAEQKPKESKNVQKRQAKQTEVTSLEARVEALQQDVGVGESEQRERLAELEAQAAQQQAQVEAARAEISSMEVSVESLQQDACVEASALREGLAELIAQVAQQQAQLEALKKAIHIDKYCSAKRLTDLVMEIAEEETIKTSIRAGITSLLEKHQKFVAPSEFLDSVGIAAVACFQSAVDSLLTCHSCSDYIQEEVHHFYILYSEYLNLNDLRVVDLTQKCNRVIFF